VQHEESLLDSHRRSSYRGFTLHETNKPRLEKTTSGLNGQFIPLGFTWDPTKLPVVLRYNPSGKHSSCPDDMTISDRVTEAYGSWSNGLSFLTFTKAYPFTTQSGWNRDETNVILWEDLGSTAHAVTYFNPTSPQGPNMTGADITCNSNSTISWHFSENAPANHTNSAVDFVETIIHELGHVAGLADLYARTDCIMYYLYPDRTNTVRVIDEGSKAGFAYQHTEEEITLSGSLPWSLDISALSGRKVYLDGDVTIPSEKAFALEYGKATVYLGSYSISVDGGSMVDAGGNTWEPADVSIVSGAGLQGHYPSITAALSAATSGQTIVVNGGSHTLSANLVVGQGITLELLGSTLSFSGNYKLRVEGVLEAEDATFTSSSGTWYGIEFYSGASGSSLNSCTIQNAAYGVYVYDTEPTITYCTIQYNSTGVYTSSCSPGMNWNLIQENSSEGVSCGSYGDPSLTPNNIIRYNGWGVHGDGTSLPYMGSYIGYNSVYWNDYYDVYSTYAGTIQACGNWWGDYPPYPTVTGNVDYSGPLQYDPNSWAKIAARPSSRSKETSALGITGDPDTIGTGELGHAYTLMMTGHESEALFEFEQLSTNYPNSIAGSKALVFSFRVQAKRGVDVQSVLSLAVSRNPNTRSAWTAQHLLVGLAMKDGDAKKALELAEQLISVADTTTAKLALYDAGNICWYRLGDKSAAVQHFTELKKRFPNDPLTISAMATLGEKPRSATKESTPSSLVTADDFDLKANYPNPFNPITTMEFQLPTEGHVRLAVYDVLGRQVAELASGVHSGGVYSARWDASSVASGIYYARFVVTDELGRVKYSKVNKLLLMK
jgi:parallel beta-helix repeat protein